MANQAPAAPKAPAKAPEKVAPAAPVTTSTPGTVPEVPKAKAERGRILDTPHVFETEEKLLEAIKGRTSGPRRPYKITIDADIPKGTYFVAGHYDLVPHGILILQKGWGTVTEIGKQPRTRAVNKDALKATIAAMPEEQRKALMAELAAL